MFDVISLNSRPSREFSWKQRPAPRSDSEEVKTPLGKDPKNYEFQVRTLLECLSVLQRQSRLIEEGVNKYLEIFFFIERSDFSDSLKRILAEQYGLQLVKETEVAGRCKAFFAIQDYSKLIQELSVDLSQFEEFYRGERPREEFNRKRIALWQYFRLSTKEVKERVTAHIRPFENLKLQVRFIESISEFENIVSQLASSIGISVTVYPNGTIDIGDLRENGIQKASELAMQLANYDQIEQIRLDDFMCAIESPLTGGQRKVLDIAINNVSDNAPVVAVIDSGVKQNELTSVFLTDEGLDYRQSTSDPRSGDPFDDLTGHGTKVACEIAYGRNIEEYFMSNTVTSLLPVTRIFPVRVGNEQESFHVPYKDIFDLNGYFAEAVQRLGIKIVNISLSGVNPRSFESEQLSEAAVELDRFAKKFGVIFVVCAGNINHKKLNDLANLHPDLRFYHRPKYFSSPHTPEVNKEINISLPADTLSGITVGGCFAQKKRAVIASFSKSYGFSSGSNSYSKPDVVALGSGDYPIDLSQNPPAFCQSSGRVPVVSPDPSLLQLDCGTSFAAPRVARALAIAQVKYPVYRPETLKCIFLHKASKTPATLKKYGQELNNARNIQNESVEFNRAFAGFGAFSAEDEIEFISDSDNEISQVIENSIGTEKIRTFKVPIAKLLGDGSVSKSNKVRLTLSVCVLPSLQDSGYPKNLKDANHFHVSAMAHINSLQPIHHPRRGKVQFRNQCIKNETRGVLVGWTSDYYGRCFPAFAQRAKNFTKNQLLDLIESDDTITISVRGLSKDDFTTEVPFSLIFSVEDLGATAQIRNRITIHL